LRAIAGTMSVLFALSAAVQWNDPDPVSWIAIYLVAAGLAAAAAAGRLPLAPNAVAFVVFVVLAGVWAPSLAEARPEAFSSFAMQAASDEEPREFMGLALCAAWTGAQTLLAARARGQSR
jgi:hypothetical protein